jgi:hypothetical protein
LVILPNAGHRPGLLLGPFLLLVHGGQDLSGGALHLVAGQLVVLEVTDAVVVAAVGVVRRVDAGGVVVLVAVASCVCRTKTCRG